MGRDAVAVLLGAPRLAAERRGGADAVRAGGLSLPARRAVRARTGGHLGGDPPVGHATLDRAPLAAGGARRRRARQPPLLRGLVRLAGDPRAGARRARRPGVGRAGLARGAAAHAAPRVRARGGGREQRPPSAAVHAAALLALRRVGVAVRGRGRPLLGAGALPARRDRPTAARGRPAALPAVAAGRLPARWHAVQPARAGEGPARLRGAGLPAASEGAAAGDREGVPRKRRGGGAGV